MIKDSIEKYEYEVNDSLKLQNEWYDLMFQQFFIQVHASHQALKSHHRITDSELETILIEIPMDLFRASETLNDLRLRYEATKLSINKKRIELRQQSTDAYLSDESLLSVRTKTEIKEMIIDKLQIEMFEDDALLNVYKSLITRVEGELSFARELIMGAKKVWDSRRSAEKSNPVSEVDLPPYMIEREEN